MTQRNGTKMEAATSGLHVAHGLFGPPSTPTVAGAPSADDFPSPVPTGDTWWPNPKFLNRTGTEVVGWTPPPALPTEIEALALALERCGHHLQAEGLRLQAGVALESRRELEQLQAMCVQELAVRNKATHAHNARIEQEITQAQIRFEEAEARFEAAREAAIEACASAGLPGDTKDVTSALAAQAPSLEAVAGGEGIVRVLGRALDGFIEVVAPIGIGFVVAALSFGPVLDIFHASELNDLEASWPKLLLATFLGAILIVVFGAAASLGMTAIATRVLQREPGEPPHRVRAPILLFGGVALILSLVILTVCEIAVGASGIHGSSVEQFTRSMRGMPEGAQRAASQAAGAIGPTPWILCWMSAAIITFPYTLYKLIKAWNAAVTAVNNDWLAYRHEQWVSERTKNQEVREAERTTSLVKQCNEEVEKYRDQLDHLEKQRLPLQEEFDRATKLRIEGARVSASGEAATLRVLALRLIQHLDTIGDSPKWARLFGQPHRIRLTRRV